MKILIHSYEYPPLGGGAANAIYYLLERYKSYPDLEIDLVTSSIGKQRIEMITDKLTIHYLDIGKNGKVHLQSNKDLLLYTFKSYLYTKKLLKNNKYDLLHAFFGIPSGYVAMMLKIPYIVSLRGSDVPFFNERFRVVDKLIFKRLSGPIWKSANQVIANSSGLRNLAHESHPRVHIDIIPNGIDTSVFYPNDTKQSRDIHIITTCRLIKRKGLDVLLTALKNLNRVNLTIIGDGPEKKRLEELASENEVSTIFLGSIEHDSIPQYLRGADVFVLSSNNEGMSNSILEAMACGLPVVTTDVGGSAELIKNNGFIVEIGNSDQLRNAILQYLESPPLINIHGVESRRIAERMDWKRVADSYYDVYKRSVSQTNVDD